MSRLAYADPPYPGKAHLYPENTEVDHAALIDRLERDYDGWALSTDERSLAYVLGLCPPNTRVMAWCRSNAPLIHPFPCASWEPVLCRPARSSGVPVVRSYFVCGTPHATRRGSGLTGQKPQGFCEWVFRAMGAQPDDELDDLFPGSGVVSEAWDAFTRQPPLFNAPKARLCARDRERFAGRVTDPLPGMDGHSDPSLGVRRIRRAREALDGEQ